MNDKPHAPALTTSRLQLVPATPALVDLELAHQDRLAEELNVDVPSDWPPEHHDAETLRFTRKALEHRNAAGWWLHYVLHTEATRRTLVGIAGYKGPPSEGVVEIGYSIVPSWRRRGLATEACGALIEAAWHEAQAWSARTPFRISKRPSACSASSASHPRNRPSRASSPSLCAASNATRAYFLS